jgi:transmembrane sensor
MQDKDLSRLLNDESFLNYCFGKNADDMRYWQNWLNENPDYRDKVDEIRNTVILLGAQSGEHEVNEQFRLLKQKIAEPKQAFEINKYSLFPYLKIAAAASILLFLSIGGYFLLYKKQPTQQIAQQHDVAPASNKAILKMANGKTIVITDAKKGLLAQQGNIAISKTANGQVAYQAFATLVNKEEKAAYDTLIVPRGGQHQLMLADGTMVWLDADSKLRIPENFSASDHTVELLTGQAYFKVAYNSRRIFKVKVKGQLTEDIGTEFNINAYDDEPVIKTTLLEGSIKVSNSSGGALLNPGQQAQTAADGNQKINVISDNDIEQTTAWKNGLFIFNRTDLHGLMRQLARWYDVQVVYDGDVKDDVFFGKIKRNNNLSQILKVLELGNVHFHIEGKKLIVLP